MQLQQEFGHHRQGGDSGVTQSYQIAVIASPRGHIISTPLVLKDERVDILLVVEAPKLDVCWAQASGPRAALGLERRCGLVQALDRRWQPGLEEGSGCDEAATFG